MNLRRFGIVLRAAPSLFVVGPLAAASCNAHGTISLDIEAARFAGNAVTEGPVITQTARTFTIAP